METPQLLTVNEAADFLRIAPGTLRNWHHAGRGPRVSNVGRCIRYKRSDLEAFISSTGAAA
jgi:excisionase family DNA binding protein